MKPKFLLILLLISMSFNVGFVFCFVYKTSAKQQNIMPAPSQRPERQSRSREFFQNEDLIVARNENIELRKQFFIELAKPEIDLAEINDLMSKLDESQRVLEQAVLNHFLNIRQEMNSEEAEEFFSRFQHRNENRPKRKIQR